MSAVIEATGLTKRYDGMEVVRGITFAVKPQECFGFLGPNGAGKTTTMRMIYGFSPVTAGSVRVFGHDIMREPRRIKARLGVVPQENNLDPDLTVLQNLLVYARYFSLPRREAAPRARDLLEFVQLTEKRDAKISTLSGGMKRRLLVARSLINEPDLLILDEPTTGLDPQARHLIWQKLRDLKRRGVTMILTTHYMEEAAQLCDRLVILDNGRILTEGSPDELVAQHVGREVVEVRLDERGSAPVLAALDGLDVTHEEAGDTLFLYAEDGDLLIARLLPVRDVEFRHRHASLEDVFLRLTGRELRE